LQEADRLPHSVRELDISLANRESSRQVLGNSDQGYFWLDWESTPSAYHLRWLKLRRFSRRGSLLLT
jgi:hypothetical protein